MTVSTWPSSSTRRDPRPAIVAIRSGALPAVEQGTRWTSASAGSSAAHSAIASSAPPTSPDGEEIATSASSSRGARAAISAAAESISRSMRAPRHRPAEQDLPGIKRLRTVAIASDPVREAREHCVDGRGDAVQAAEEHDLAVEVVALDLARAPLQALPGRGPGPPAATARRAVPSARRRRTRRRPRTRSRRPSAPLCPPPGRSRSAGRRPDRAQQIAPTALARFRSSFACLRSITSPRARALKRADSSASTIASQRSSAPCG